MPRSTHLRSDRGATLVEYSLLVALIAVVSIAALSALSDNSAAAFEDASQTISGGDDSSAEPGPSNPGPSDPGPSDPGPGGPGPDDDAHVGGDETEDEGNDDNDEGGNDNDAGEDDSPVEETSSGWATRDGNSHNWDAHAEVQLMGKDGQPLAGSALVEFEVTTGGVDEDGDWVEKVSTEWKWVYDGKLAVSEKASDKDPKKDKVKVTTVTFEVVNVSSWSGEWDGNVDPVQVLAP